MSRCVCVYLGVCVVGATKCAWVNHPVFAVKIKWQTNVVTYGEGEVQATPTRPVGLLAQPLTSDLSLPVGAVNSLPRIQLTSTWHGFCP